MWRLSSNNPRAQHSNEQRDRFFQNKMSFLLLVVAVALASVANASKVVLADSRVAMHSGDVLRVEKVGDGVVCSYCVSFMSQALNILVQIIANSGCVCRTAKKSSFF
jgi:hypothetical protein